MTRVRMLFRREFWLDAAERAIKSAAQGAAGMLTLDQFTDRVAADWRLVVSAGAVSAVYSVLTSIASAPTSGVSPASALPPGA